MACTEQVRCQYLVACDGPNSRVRRAVGLEQEESDYKGTTLQNLDAFLNGFPDVDDYVHYCAGTDHFIMIVKLPGGFYRMLLSDRGEAAAPNVSPEQGFMRLVDKHFDDVTLGKIVWHSKWQSFVRLAHTYRKGRVFLAGDSAHIHSTTGGQGLNCCMQDSYNLGWKLAFVVKGLARPASARQLRAGTPADRRAGDLGRIVAARDLHGARQGHRRARAEDSRPCVPRCRRRTLLGYLLYVSRQRRSEASAVPPSAIAHPTSILPGGHTLFELTRHPRCTLLALPATEGGTKRRSRRV